MKKPEILVGEVKVAELRKRLRPFLESKVPLVVRRNSRVVAILLHVESSWFGHLEHPIKQRQRLAVELEAVLRKLSP